MSTTQSSSLALNPESPLTQEDDEYERRFAGLGRVYGENKLSHYEKSHVMVVGIGGVGSWAVEALARSAIGTITLVDMDVLVASNVNRQLPAVTENFGKEKALAMAERIYGINPRAVVNIVDEFLTPENIEQLLTVKPDVIFDCTDDGKAKVALIKHCRFHKIALIVSGAGGGKTDPLSIRVADLACTESDPLLSRIRGNLRTQLKIKIDPKHKLGVTCIYSVEQMKRPTECNSGGLHCGGYGSATVMTASMALVGVAEVLKKLDLQGLKML